MVWEQHRAQLPAVQVQGMRRLPLPARSATAALAACGAAAARSAAAAAAGRAAELAAVAAALGAAPGTAVAATTGGMRANVGGGHRLRDVLLMVRQQPRRQLPAMQVPGVRRLPRSAATAGASGVALARSTALAPTRGPEPAAVAAPVAARGVRARGHRLRGYRLRGLLPVVWQQSGGQLPPVQVQGVRRLPRAAVAASAALALAASAPAFAAPAVALSFATSARSFAPTTAALATATLAVATAFANPATAVVAAYALTVAPHARASTADEATRPAASSAVAPAAVVAAASIRDHLDLRW